MTSAAHPLAARGGRARLGRLPVELRFRDAVVFTLLPLLALAILLGATARAYLQARQFDDWWSKNQTFAYLFSARVNGLAGLPRLVGLRDRIDPEARDPGVIRLEVDGAAWDQVAGDPQAGWGEWADGVLRYGRSQIAVRLRKRGDNSIHWITDKHSLTVRTPRDDFYKQFRSFGLSVKDVLPSYLSNRLAREFGLLAPATEVVPVFLNGRYYGMYRFLEIVDESFLRPFDRMPGNIFRGDRAERGEYHKGTPRALFANPALWERAAVNDRWTSAGPGQLSLLLEDLAGGTFPDHRRLMGRLDPEEFARLFAYLLVVGDPYHMSQLHNQLLYEDPSTQQLHPIPWDIRLLPLAAGATINDLFQGVLENPRVVDATMAEVARRVGDESLVEIADNLVTGAERRYAPHFAYDRLRRGLVPDVGRADEAMRILRGNVQLLRQWVEDDTVAFAATADAGTVVLDFESRGRVGSDLVGLVSRSAGQPTLRLDANLNGRLDPEDPVVPLSTERAPDGLTRYRPAHAVALLAAWDTRGPGIRAGHVAYRLFLSGLRAGSPVIPELLNRATHRAAAVTAWEPGTAIRAATAWHPWRYPVLAPRTHRFSGTVLLRQTLRIPAGDTLIVEPGTTLRLAPEVSLVVSGRLLARGTADRPIRVLPADPGRPWGTFSLQGHGADSSMVTHTEIAGGGGALVDRIEYIGMVNVHRADGVVFEHVRFRDNVRSDDTFHALHARVWLRHSTFLRGNSDAVDFDLSSGEVVGNVFDATGGDAIDLMTSTPYIADNVIRGSGDKGISIGEGSHPIIVNNRIADCSVGFEVKDRSEPVILHTDVGQCGTGFRERRKNWRYGGGGWATVVESRFSGNKRPWVRDPFSRVTLSAVEGLSLSNPTTATPPVDLAWLYQLVGVRPRGEAPPGPLLDYQRVAPVEPVDRQRFRDDFSSMSGGWEPGANISRLEQRRDALVIEVAGESGQVTKPVSWELPAGGTLVLELTSRDLGGGIAFAEGPEGRAEHRFQSGGDPASAQLIVMPLPAGRYTRLGLDLSPIPGLTQIDPATGLGVIREGRVDLRSYVVLSGEPQR